VDSGDALLITTRAAAQDVKHAAAAVEAAGAVFAPRP